MTYTKSFIESQFPVSIISKESYKERIAGGGQTLTGLGKWWGRKPLILVRAIILGLLMPASEDPKMDRKIFLKILTMDDEGLWLRKERNIQIEEYYKYSSESERSIYFSDTVLGENAILSWNNNIKPDQKNAFQKIIFNRLSYDDKLKYCVRPEQALNISTSEWDFINSRLGTSAESLQELVEQLGQKQFGHTPCVGDVFCGGGSIPFEASRIGCESVASDLNPVAALITWASLNIIGGNSETARDISKSQEAVYNSVNNQILDWEIEVNEEGWRADAYLYCVEIVDPVTNFTIPLAPSWVIGEKTRTVAKLIKNEANHSYDIEIHSGVSDDEMDDAKENGTVKGGYIINPNDKNIRTSVQILRGDRKMNKETIYGLRMWERNDIVPRDDDIFKERLYCIRYVETYYERIIQVDTKKILSELRKEEAEALPNFLNLYEAGQLKRKTRKHYVAPNSSDLRREEKVLKLLRERFNEWQINGYLPSSKIEEGDKTEEPIRTRGWTYWHHLFNPRQLLFLGLFSSKIFEESKSKVSTVENLLEIGRLIDTKGIGSKLLRWNPHRSKEGHASVFSNQALNTLFNYCTRTLVAIKPSVENEIKINNKSGVETKDARDMTKFCDYWITDPPYADAVSYHELADYFLSWYKKIIPKLFPEWYSDSKKSLAIKGEGEDFRKGMVEAYKNLTLHMSENGAQVVMFTHQDSSVWADLALILWASGLQVSAAWTIATETDSALKSGNYVQGTVCMVLRKQTTEAETFINDVYPEVEQQVIEQLKAMTLLDDKENPNFSDSDYQLAAYAAALRVLTSYRQIHPIDIKYELSKSRKREEKSEVEKLIDKAVAIATNYLVPEGLDRDLWITLRPEEKFYLKGLEVETHGEYRSGVYQEFARGFGVKEYRNMLSSGKANETHLRSALEFKNKNLRDDGFGSSLLRQVLFAIHETNLNENPLVGKQFLRDEIKDYWQNRQKLIALSRFVQKTGARIDNWKEDAVAANLLAGALENDHL